MKVEQSGIPAALAYTAAFHISILITDNMCTPSMHLIQQQFPYGRKSPVYHPSCRQVMSINRRSVPINSHMISIQVKTKPHISCELSVDVSLDVAISSSCFDSSFTTFSAARAGMPEKSRLGSGRCVFMATALAGLPRKGVVASGSSWLPRCVFGAGG
eukprot:scaffold10271_cov119-Skeletonema_dohrnii-CCMP3373.AAC.4